MFFVFYFLLPDCLLLCMQYSLLWTYKVIIHAKFVVQTVGGGTV